MPIAFHTNAEKRFNERAETLRNEVKLAASATPQHTGQSFVPTREASATLTEADIGRIGPLAIIDSMAGELLGLQFAFAGQTYELGSEACAELNDLAQTVWKPLRKKVSLERIFEEAKKWLDPANEDKRTFCSRLVEEISPDLKSAIHWVPIANLHVQSPLEFADVVFREISKTHFDEWFAKAQATRPEDASLLAHHFKQQREKYQSFAAATIEIEAEPSYGPQVAIESATKAVTLLRTFCPENFFVQACSFTLPFGRTFIPHDDVWTQDATGAVPRTQINGDIPPPSPWIISDASLLDMRKFGFAELSKIARSDEPTKFQERLLDALQIYNRANISAHPGDKVFFVVVALEMILLKNDKESLQLAMGDRLAFAVGKTIDERLRIVALVRETYDLRSKWVHHGRAPQGNAPIINKFLHLAWTFFTSVMCNESKYSTHEALIDYLERLKYR